MSDCASCYAWGCMPCLRLLNLPMSCCVYMCDFETLFHAVGIDEVYALEELFKAISNRLHKVRPELCPAISNLVSKAGPSLKAGS